MFCIIFWCGSIQSNNMYEFLRALHLIINHIIPSNHPLKWFKLWPDAYLDSKPFFSQVINYFGNFLCDNFWYNAIAKTFFRVFFHSSIWSLTVYFISEFNSKKITSIRYIQMCFWKFDKFKSYNITTSPIFEDTNCSLFPLEQIEKHNIGWPSMH